MANSFFDQEDLASTKSSFFDEQDLIAPPVTKTKGAGSSFFDQDDLVGGSPVSEQGEKEQPVTGEENHSWIGQVITDQDIDRIAAKHSVDPGMLKSRVGLYGGNYSPADGDLGDELVEAGKTLTGKALNTIPFSLHKFVDKKLHSDPNERAALDDLNELVYNKSGKLDIAADMAGQALLTTGAGALANSLGKAGTFQKILKGIDSTGGIIAQGAVAGLNESKEDHELAGVALGAAIAGGLVGLGKGAGKVLGKKGAKAAEGETEEAVKLAEKLVDGEGDNALRILKQVEQDPATAAHASTVKDPTKLESFSAYRKAEELAPLRSGESSANKSMAEAMDEVVAKLEKGEVTAAKGSLTDSIKTDQVIMEKLAGKGVDPEQISKQLVEEFKGWNRAREEVVKFAQDLVNPEIKTFEQASSALKEKALQEGQEQMGRYYEKYRFGRELKKELAGKYDAYSPDMISRAFDKFADGVLVYRQMDKLYGGIGAQELQMNLSKHMSSYINVKASLLQDAKLKFRNMEKAAGEGFDLREFVKDKTVAQVTKDMESLPANHRKVVEDFRTFMEKGLQAANADDAKAGVKGLNIQKYEQGLKEYIPDIVADTKQVILTMDNKIEQLNKEIGQDIKRFAPDKLEQVLTSMEETSQAAKDVLDGLKFLSRQEKPDGTALREVLLSYDKVGKTRSSLQIHVSAAHEKKGGIPEFLLERDPVKLVNKWYNQTLKAKYHRQDLYEMKQLASTLRALGDETNASYVENHIKDLAGVRHDTFATAYQNRKLAWDIAWQRKINGTENEWKRSYYKSMQMLPQVLGVMQAGMYPFYLGMKVSNVVRNLTQPIFTTALEGVTLHAPFYGAAKVAGAMGEAYSTMINPVKFKALIGEMKAKGLMPPEFDPQMIRWAREGVDDELAKTKLGGLLHLKDAGARIDNLAMMAYGLSDTMNRVVTYKAAEAIALDVAKGNPKALSTLKNLSKGTEARVLDLLKQGNIREAQDNLAKSLIATTQFNYDRASLNEFGRTFGTFFSAFTKWPANVAGDIVYTAKEARGLYGKDQARMSAAQQKIMLKYFAPLGLMMLGDIAADVTEAKDDPWFQLLNGHGSMTGFAPTASLFPFAEGRGLNIMPAAAQQLGKAGMNTVQGDRKLRDWLTVVMQGMPGGVLYKFLDKDIKDWEGVTGMDLQPEIFKDLREWDRKKRDD